MLKGYPHPKAILFFSAIKTANKKGSLDQVADYIEKFPSLVNAVNQKASALSTAISLDAIDVARFLIEKGADPNMERYTQDGDTCVPVFEVKSRAGFDLLVEHGAQLDYVSISGHGIDHLFTVLSNKDFLHVLECAEKQGAGLRLKRARLFMLERMANTAAYKNKLDQFMDLWSMLTQRGMINPKTDRCGEQNALFKCARHFANRNEALLAWVVEQGLRVDNRILPSRYMKDVSNQFIEIICSGSERLVTHLMPVIDPVDDDVAQMMLSKIQSEKNIARFICLLDRAGKFDPVAPENIKPIALHALSRVESMEDFLYLRDTLFPRAGMKPDYVVEVANFTPAGDRILSFEKASKPQAFLDDDFISCVRLKGVIAHQLAISDPGLDPQRWMNALVQGYSSLSITVTPPPYHVSLREVSDALISGLSKGYPMPHTVFLNEAPADLVAVLSSFRMNQALNEDKTPAKPQSFISRQIQF